nr:serine/arginine repetitive matrix protein 1-like [Aegilops tauschii subsp. strangulata]
MPATAAPVTPPPRSRRQQAPACRRARHQRRIPGSRLDPRRRPPLRRQGSPAAAYQASPGAPSLAAARERREEEGKPADSARVSPVTRARGASRERVFTRTRKKRNSNSEDEDYVAAEEEVSSKKKVLKKEYGAAAAATKPGMHKKAPAKRVSMSNARASTHETSKSNGGEVVGEGKKRKERVKKTMAKVIGRSSMMRDLAEDEDEEEEDAAPASKSQKLMGDAIKMTAEPLRRVIVPAASDSESMLKDDTTHRLECGKRPRCDSKNKAEDQNVRRARIKAQNAAQAESRFTASNKGSEAKAAEDTRAQI